MPAVRDYVTAAGDAVRLCRDTHPMSTPAVANQRRLGLMTTVEAVAAGLARPGDAAVRSPGGDR